MSGEGINGLDGLRNRLDKTVDVVGDVRAEVARQGAIQQAQGREIHDVKETVRAVDIKQDAIIDELAVTRGVSVQRKSSFGGVVALVAVAAGISGIVATILGVIAR